MATSDEESEYGNFLEFDLVAQQETNAEIVALKETIKKFQDESIVTCEKYSQEITKTKEMIDQLKLQTENQITGYKDELQRLNTELSNKVSELEKLKKESEFKFRDLNKKDAIISEYSSKILKAEESLSEKEKQFEDLKLSLINAQNKIASKDQICYNLDAKVQFNEKKSNFFKSLNDEQKKEVEKLQTLLDSTNKALSSTLIESSLDHAKLVTQVQELSQKVQNVENERNSTEFLLRETQNKTTEKLIIQCTEKDKLEAELNSVASLYKEAQEKVMKQNEKLSELSELVARKDLDFQTEKNHKQMAIAEVIRSHNENKARTSTNNNLKIVLKKQEEKVKKFTTILFNDLKEILDNPVIELKNTGIRNLMSFVSNSFK